MSSDTSHSIPIPGPAPRDFHYKYTVEKGLFLQSEDSTDDTTFDFVSFSLHGMRLSKLTDVNFPAEEAELRPHKPQLPHRHPRVTKLGNLATL